MANTDFAALCDMQSSAANTVAGLKADVAYWKGLLAQCQAANTPPAVEPGLIRTEVMHESVALLCDHDIDEDGVCTVFAAWAGAADVLPLMSDEAVDCVSVRVEAAIRRAGADDAHHVATAGVPSLREEVEA